MERARVCLICDTTNDSLLKFCTACGASLGPLCVKCGTMGRFGELFCGMCGTVSVSEHGQSGQARALTPFDASVAVKQYSVSDIALLLELRNSLNLDRTTNETLRQSDIDDLFEKP